MNNFYAQNDGNWVGLKIEDVRVSDNLAVVRFITDYTYTNIESGETMGFEGATEVVVHQKEKDGNWKILYQAAVYPEYSAVE